MVAANTEASGSHFMDYLSMKNLPVSQAAVRVARSCPLTIASIEHAPNRGVWFDPIDDLVISIVLRSDSSKVTRDVGYGKAEFRYKPGTILITPAGTPSYWSFEGKPHVLHLSLPHVAAVDMAGASAASAADTIRSAASEPLHDPLIAEVAKRIWRHEEADHEDATVVERGIGFIMGLVLAHRDDAPRVTPRRTNLPEWQLNKVLEVMHERKLGVSVGELADCLGMSTDHFIRSFKAATGLSPGQKLRNLCLEEAMDLLRQNRMSITEVSMELGFSSPSHFATFFRSQTGDAPSEWLAHLPHESRRH